MIVLKKIYTRFENNKIYFCANVIINSVETEIWFAADQEYGNYISLSNGDSFILLLFVYAVFNDLDFESHVPVSKRLNYGLLEILLPLFQKMKFNTNAQRFKFHGIDTTVFEGATASGTAMSFGVDSFYTYLKQQDSNMPIDFLTLFNAGGYGQYGGNKARQLFEHMTQKVIRFGQQNNLKVLSVDTNWNEILKMPFVKTHTFRNFACVLVFQKLFKNYYYASGLTLNSFDLNPHDPAYYDIVNVKAIAGNSLEFFISGLNEGRLEKTTYIADQQLTYNNLNVCYFTPDSLKSLINDELFINCSKCYKCVRTMITLDVIGKLELYKNIFDLNIYNKNKEIYLAEILYQKIRTNSIFSIEILNQMKLNKYSYSSKVYFCLVKKIASVIIDKFKK